MNSGLTESERRGTGILSCTPVFYVRNVHDKDSDEDSFVTFHPVHLYYY